MKKTSLLIILLLCVASPNAKEVYIRGHYRSDGTYVQPHYRSSPNLTRNDNWTTKGNKNPHTEKKERLKGD